MRPAQDERAAQAGRTAAEHHHVIECSSMAASCF
jgi:hypothetical protein